MARLLADENFPYPALYALTRAGHEVATLDTLGEAGRALPDQAVLALALAEGRALVTLNRRHFIRLHLAGVPHAGLIVCTFDPDFEVLAARIDVALQAAGPLGGQLLRVQRPVPGSAHSAS